MSPGNWNLVVCGISHKLTSLADREPLQIGRNEMPRANAVFADMPGIMESAIVSTCNRIEFYFCAGKSEDIFDLIKVFYKNFNDQDISDKQNLFYIRKNKHAAAHLLAVAAGLDSMVIGENQILGQIKEAYTSACAVKTAGKVIHRLFHQAFRVGKQVRTDTEMGQGACSVSNAAIELLESKIANLKKPSILFVGINQMIALAANGVGKLDYGRMYFANRTVEKAEAFAKNFDSHGYPLSELPDLIKNSDIVISCTGAEEPVISRNMLDDFLQEVPGKKLLMVDLAIPRDIELAKDYNARIELYDLEDIKLHVEQHRQKRELAIPQAQEIIENKLSEFLYWFEHIRYEPLYNGLGDTFEIIRQEELSSVLEKLPEDTKEEIEMATRRMVNKLLQLKVRTSE